MKPPSIWVTASVPPSYCTQRILPRSALGTPAVAISISFWWSGSPPEEQQSAVSVPVQGGGTPGNTGVLPAAKVTEEIAEALECSLSTVKRDWRLAKAWLQCQFDAR